MCVGLGPAEWCKLGIFKILASHGDIQPTGRHATWAKWQTWNGSSKLKVSIKVKQAQE